MHPTTTQYGCSEVTITVTRNFVLRHLNCCSFNGSHFPPLPFSTECLLNRLLFQPPIIRPIFEFKVVQFLQDVRKKLTCQLSFIETVLISDALPKCRLENEHQKILKWAMQNRKYSEKGNDFQLLLLIFWTKYRPIYQMSRASKRRFWTLKKRSDAIYISLGQPAWNVISCQPLCTFL